MIKPNTYNFEDITLFRLGKSEKGKPNMFAYVFYIDGLLIDTGQSKSGKHLFSKVKDLKVDQMFITHYHEDHSGNIKQLQEHFDCPVYASKLCCSIMKNPPSISFAQSSLWGKRPAYKTLIEKSGTIKTKNYEFEIIPVYGHAPDMVVLYEPNKKWLFSADLFVNTSVAFYLYNESCKDQIASLKRILKLDFDVLLCCHNPQLTNGKEKLQMKLEFLENFYAQVSKMYAEEKTAKQIFRNLKIKEDKVLKFISLGALSKFNMVKSVIRDINGVNVMDRYFSRYL